MVNPTCAYKSTLPPQINSQPTLPIGTFSHRRVQPEEQAQVVQPDLLVLPVLMVRTAQQALLDLRDRQAPPDRAALRGHKEQRVLRDLLDLRAQRVQQERLALPVRLDPQERLVLRD